VQIAERTAELVQSAVADRQGQEHRPVFRVGLMELLEARDEATPPGLHLPPAADRAHPVIAEVRRAHPLLQLIALCVPQLDSDAFSASLEVGGGVPSPRLGCHGPGEVIGPCLVLGPGWRNCQTGPSSGRWRGRRGGIHWCGVR
jgi:hypothetical protein